MADEKADDVIVKIEGEGDGQLSLLIDDPNEKPAPKAKPAAKAKDDDEVADLRKQMRTREAELETARETEASRRRAAEAEVAEARKQVATTQADAINAALTSAKSEADALQAQITQAYETGEYQKAGELNRKLARAEATIMRYEDAKVQLDEQAKKPVVETKQEPSSADPFEQSIARLSKRAQGWMREHREYATDRKLNSRLIAAHHEAMADDHTPDSDAYFEFIEAKLGMNKGDDDGQDDTADPPRRQPRVSAPVSREAPTSRNGVSGNRVTLTRAEVEIAKDLGMTEKEYAQYKMRAVQEGRYDQR